MQRRFVVISGLPGSGKTTLALQLAPVLSLPVIDKDSILESLFVSSGVGDAEWRRTLSRESDTLLQAQAAASGGGAILVSFWRQSGMPDDSGTPTAWLASLSSRFVHLHCVCPLEIAAERFLRRRRHPGHLDTNRSREDVLESLKAVANFEPVQIDPRIEVDTNRQVNLQSLAHDIGTALRRCG